MKTLAPLLFLLCSVTACLESPDPPTEVPILDPPSETTTPSSTVSPSQNPPNSGQSTPTYTPPTTASETETIIVADKCLPIIIDQDRYFNTSSDSFTLVGVRIQNHCLSINIEHSGGCKDAVGELVDEGVVMESFPPQRNTRFIFRLNDSCESLIRQEFLFDLKPLQIVGVERLILRFADVDLKILYTY